MEKGRKMRRRMLVTYLLLLLALQSLGLLLVFFTRNAIGIFLLAFVLGTALPVGLGLAFYFYFKRTSQQRKEI